MGATKKVSEHWAKAIPIVGAPNRGGAGGHAGAVAAPDPASDHSSDMSISDMGSQIPSDGASDADGAVSDDAEEPEASDPNDPLNID